MDKYIEMCIKITSLQPPNNQKGEEVSISELIFFSHKANVHKQTYKSVSFPYMSMYCIYRRDVFMFRWWGAQALSEVALSHWFNV